MNWDALGAIGEIVGAAGVILTLGYLAIQIKQNSRLLKLSNTQQTLDASRDSFLSAINQYDIPELLHKQTNLSPQEEMALQFWTNAQMRNFENAYLQYKEGALDQEANETFRAIGADEQLATILGVMCLRELSREHTGYRCVY